MNYFKHKDRNVEVDTLKIYISSRLSPWVYVWAVYAVSIVFPAFDDEYKKFLTFGIWKENDVGYKKSAPQPYN
ncbi:hypothetical protein PFTANZ_01899 [Plasmodium falciparum Tanzania (2000708)]|uniref:Uncharacterized protein n=1 Tax=Plasmodium falciparum Tanzania (2000708) TaxID=1036725 RepID=A0A024W974_PLAFA|nr:hypothetical protein PFTANZ_01899 [Plasmodium falciparum Tanzania (2000708)]